MIQAAPNQDHRTVTGGHALIQTRANGTQASTTPPASATRGVLDHEALWSTVIWAVVATIALIILRKHVRKLLDAFAWRLRSGAPITIGSLELPAEEARPEFITEKEAKSRGVRIDDGSRRQERETFYHNSRRVMLVHRLLRSFEAGELYDIVIYVIPAYRGTLAGVQTVEYYFGGHGWQEKVFPAIDRANGFPVVTAAYGPFLCTAKITFTDGDTVILHRFIDFEMGDYAPLSPLRGVPVGE